MNAGTLVGLAAALGTGGLILRRAMRVSRAVDFSGLSVLVIGGSRGLGLVIARQLANEGARLALAARDIEELERARTELAERGAAVITIACDVRQRADVDQAIHRVIDEYGVIDVLINDAGIILVGPMDHMTEADFEDAMATHFWGPLFTMRAALPHMRTRGAGRIVNISSIGGKIAVPHLAPYCASKFALTGLSESLHTELAREGIRVTTVCPGLMRTGSTYNAKFKGQHRSEFAWFHTASSIPGLTVDATTAARQIIEACRYGDAELVITPAAKLAVLMNAISPRTVAAVMSLANSLLPGTTSEKGDETRSGWQSVSWAAPSPVTTLSDRASVENNEVIATSS